MRTKLSTSREESHANYLDQIYKKVEYAFIIIIIIKLISYQIVVKKSYKINKF